MNNHAKEQLNGFPHGYAYYIKGQDIREEEELIYPDSVTTSELADSWPRDKYIKKREKTILNFVQNIAIFQQYNLSTFVKQHHNILVWRDERLKNQYSCLPRSRINVSE